MFQSGLQADIFGNSASNFATWVTTSRRRCSSLRQTLARRMSASGCSSSADWLTPAGVSGNHGPDGSECAQQAKAWASPVVNGAGGTAEQFLDRKRKAVEAGASMGIALTDLGLQAQQWATAQAHDTDPRGKGNRRNPNGGNACLASDAMEFGANWPSARAEDSESAGNHPNATDSLTGAAKNWPSPRALTDAKGAGQKTERDDGKSREDQLAYSATSWATPNVPNRGPEKRASKAARGSGGVDVQTQAIDFPCSRPDETTTDDGLRSLLAVWTRPVCPRLSPNFQHWLMGWAFPIRNSFDSAEMGSYRSALQWRLRFCLGVGNE